MNTYTLLHLISEFLDEKDLLVIMTTCSDIFSSVVMRRLFLGHLTSFDSFDEMGDVLLWYRRRLERRLTVLYVFVVINCAE